ncbi:MAG TPA: prepilin-type N-terminal cleavage/methylation domain-containing protein [bacterium]|nr:prepilin-type N-terminal cleavage/methylation domain-containing protein [bacterium]HPP30189.1 prepilin-type N-terminal cleavage/methylation domain-containing protein [bacterium]
MKAKKGVTLIELMIALIIVAIGLVAVISFLYASWRDFYISGGIKALQEDMDLAGLNIKAVLEEANYYEIQDIIEGSEPPTGRKIYAKYSEDEEVVWEKAIYHQGNKLVMEDIKNTGTYAIINTLQDISFSDAGEEDTELINTVKVDIKVYKSGKSLENKFSVKVRNK